MDIENKSPEEIRSLLAGKSSKELEQILQSTISKLPRQMQWPQYLPTDKIDLIDKVVGMEHVRQINVDGLPNVYAPKLRALKEEFKHKKRCFLIGNGPSLNRTDLDVLKDEVTFAVNGFFLKAEQLDWTPTFFCVEDRLVAEDRAKWINDFKGPIKFFPGYLGYMFPEDDDTIFYNHQPRKSFPHGFDFSKDADEITYTGCTVTFSLMQLATYLGFEEIYLIGVDASYAIPDDAKSDGKYGVGVLDMKSDDPNHFDPNYFGKGFRWHDPQVDKMIGAYTEAKKCLEGTSQKIINATVGGQLEVFERRSFNDIFPHARSPEDVQKANDAAAASRLRISVITPSFNQAQFLPDNLKTVSEQEGVDLEHIIVDPGSTDGSTEIARQATHAKLINEPDRGQSHGIVRGFERCTGDIMTWLNSDDYYPSNDTLRKVAEIFASEPDVDIVYGRVNFVNEDHEVIRRGYVNPDSENLLKSLEFQVGIVQPGVFWRKKVFEDLGGPSEEYDFCMDYELWVRMADGGFKWRFIDDTLAHHRWWDGMKTASDRDLSLIEHFRVGLRYFGYIHWKWFDRYADYMASEIDGVINWQHSTDEDAKALHARQVIERYTTQDMLTLLEQSDKPEHKETLDYIRKYAPTLKRIMFNDSDLGEPIYSHPDPQAESRVAWNIFDTTTKGSDRRYKSYRVDGNFVRHFESDWYAEQNNLARARLLELSANRKDTCVVVANGPSLNKSDLSLLDDADVIISNFATINEELLSKATYFTVVNDLVGIQGSTDFNKLDIPKIVPFWMGNSINPSPNTIYLPATVVPEFQTEPADLISWRSTVSFYNMQLAFGLGYENVVLIGFDHSYVQAEELKEGDSIDQKTEDPNHFDPRYFQGKTWQAADTGNMEKMYELVREGFEKAGRRIVNATEGGKLEVFPRMGLREAIQAGSPSTAAGGGAVAPRLLVLDMTAMGNGTATGEIKSNLTKDWPTSRILQLARHGKDGVSLVRPDADGGYAEQPLSEAEAVSRIKAFRPDVILYRPVPNVPWLHKLSMSLIDELDLPLMTWIMDDWPAELAVDDPDQWAELEPDLLRLLDRSAVRLSICQSMSNGMGERYGVPFTALANGVDPADWQTPRSHEKKRLRIRYAGGLAQNMTRESVLRIARVVERMGDAGHPIKFEINTQPWWYRQAEASFSTFKFTTLTSEDRTAKAYRAWLNRANVAVIAYNFDDTTLRYVRYSMANKMPECLASGAVLFAHGPTEAATISYLEGKDIASVVTVEDEDRIEAELLRLMSNPDERQAIADRAREFVFENHNINTLGAQLRDLTRQAMSGEPVSATTPKEVVIEPTERVPAPAKPIAASTALQTPPPATSKPPELQSNIVNLTPAKPQRNADVLALAAKRSADQLVRAVIVEATLYPDATNERLRSDKALRSALAEALESRAVDGSLKDTCLQMLKGSETALDIA